MELTKRVKDLIRRLDDRYIAKQVNKYHQRLAREYIDKLVEEQVEPSQIFDFADEYFLKNALHFPTPGPIETGTQFLIELFRKNDELAKHVEGDEIYKAQIRYEAEIKLPCLFSEMTSNVWYYAVDRWTEKGLSQVRPIDAKRLFEALPDMEPVGDLNYANVARYNFMRYIRLRKNVREQAQRY